MPQHMKNMFNLIKCAMLAVIASCTTLDDDPAVRNRRIVSDDRAAPIGPVETSSWQSIPMESVRSIYIEFSNIEETVRVDVYPDGRANISRTRPRAPRREDRDWFQSIQIPASDVFSLFEAAVDHDFLTARLPKQWFGRDLGVLESGAVLDGGVVKYRRSLLLDRCEPAVIGYIERRIARLVGLSEIVDYHPFQ